MGCTEDEDCVRDHRCVGIVFNEIFANRCYPVDSYPRPLLNGEACFVNEDCSRVQWEAVCLEGACRPSSPAGGPCDEDLDCDNRETSFELVCVDNICED